MPKANARRPGEYTHISMTPTASLGVKRLFTCDVVGVIGAERVNWFHYASENYYESHYASL